MKSIHIAIKDLLITARDWQGLMIFLLMPMILTAILGSALAGNFATTPSIGNFAVAFVDQDNGELAHTLRQVFNEPELASMIKLVSMSEEEAVAAIRENKLQVALLVPQCFTASVYANDNANLTVLKDAGSSLRPMIVESIAKTFVEYVSAGRLATQLAIETAAVGQSDLNPAVVAGQIVSALHSVDVRFKEEVTAPHRSLISSFQYYAAAMAVMFMLMSGGVGLESIAAEKRNLTWERLLSSPTSPATVVIGKFIAVFLVNFLQFMLLLLGTKYLYGVSWGDSTSAVLIAGACYAVAVSGLSLLVAASMPSDKVSLAVWNISVQVFSALGGSMVPLMIFPKAIQQLAVISPNYWGLRVFTALMGGDSLQFLHVLPLLLIGIVAISIGGGQLIWQQRRA